MNIRTRAFHLWFRIRRPMTLGVRGLVFDAQGCVLLVRHTYVGGWHLCGGGVEPGETAQEALVKELREEANVELTEEPKLVSVHFNRRASKRDHVLMFLAHNVLQTKEKVADREIAQAHFFDPADLPEGTTAATKRRIEEHLGRHPPSADW